MDNVDENIMFVIFIMFFFGNNLFYIIICYILYLKLKYVLYNMNK